MAYVWKKEGRRGRGGRLVGVLSGHPYAYYAFAPRSVTLCGIPAPATPSTPVRNSSPLRLGDAACELKRLINIWNKGGRFRGRTPERYTAGYDGRYRAVKGWGGVERSKLRRARDAILGLAPFAKTRRGGWLSLSLEDQESVASIGKLAMKKRGFS